MHRRVIRGVLLWVWLAAMELEGGAILLRLRDDARNYIVIEIVARVGRGKLWCLVELFRR